MSKHKSNVNPGQYKVAGRERQGEDIIHDRQKAMLTQNWAGAQHREPWPQRPAPTDRQAKQESAATQAAELALEELSRGSKGARRATARDSAEPGPGRAPKKAHAAGKASRSSARRKSAPPRSTARKAAPTRARG